MILEYGKLKENNMTYTEAEDINIAIVNGVNNVIKDFYSNRKEAHTDKEKLYTANFLHKTVNSYIKSKVDCADEIIYHIGEKPFDKMTSILVVNLLSRGIPMRTYVFDKCVDSEISVFLLNNNGKTINRYN